MKNGQGTAMLAPAIPTGPEGNAQLSIEDLFAIIGKKQVLLEVLQTRIEQLGEMNSILQREVALLKQGSAIPNSGIDSLATEAK